MGHVWSAWGPNPEEGQMVPGIEDRTPINMRKERDRGGGNRYPLSLFSPSIEIREGVTHLPNRVCGTGTQLGTCCQLNSREYRV